MATLTTTPTEVGSNLGTTVGCRLLAWYTDNGTSGATAHLKLQAISQGITYTGTNKDYEMTLGSNATGTVSWSYAPLDADVWYDVNEITLWMGSGTTVSASGKVWTYVYGDAWITDVSLTMPVFATAPTGLAVSDLTASTDSFSGTVSVTGWGGVGDASTRYRELQVWTYDPSSLEQPRRLQTEVGNTLSSTITVDNNSASTLVIVPNTRYTIGIYATNGTYNTGSQRVGNYVTLAPKTTLTISSKTDTSAVISYSVPADGGFYSKDLEYSIDGGSTWTTVTTIVGSAATTGSFTISGLTPETSYTLKSRVVTTAGATTNNDRTFTTEGSQRIYGSVNGETKRITKIYGAVPVPQSQFFVVAISGNNNFNNSTFNSAYYNTYGKMLLRPAALVVSTSNSLTTVSIKFFDNSTKYLFQYSGTYINQGRAWGFTFAPVAGNVSSNEVTTYDYKTKRITKVYGSVNGQTKRIY